MGGSYYPRIYKPGPGPMEPVADIGQNIVLLTPGSGFDVYQVWDIAPLAMDGGALCIDLLNPPGGTQLGPLTAGTASAQGQTLPQAVDISQVLNMSFGQVAQYRYRVLGPFAVTPKQPQATGIMQTQHYAPMIGEFEAVADRYDTRSETFTYEQQPVYLQPTNLSRQALATAKVLFQGYRYVLAGYTVDNQIRPSNGSQSVNAIMHFDNLEDLIQAANRGELQYSNIVPVQAWGR